MAPAAAPAAASMEAAKDEEGVACVQGEAADAEASVDECAAAMSGLKTERF